MFKQKDLEEKKFHYYTELQTVKEELAETKFLLENSENKLLKATKHNEKIVHLANNYLSILNNFISGYKSIITHFLPCFKGLA